MLQPDRFTQLLSRMGTANPLAKPSSASPALGYLWSRTPNSCNVCFLQRDSSAALAVLGSAGFSAGCGKCLPEQPPRPMCLLVLPCWEITSSRNCSGSFRDHGMLSTLSRITLVYVVCFREHEWHWWCGFPWGRDLVCGTLLDREPGCDPTKQLLSEEGQLEHQAESPPWAGVLHAGSCGIH